MRVTETMTFDAYWLDQAFFDKRPVRNGSRKMILGDNIYHHDQNGDWLQEDSHHSRPDGSRGDDNVQRDTSADRVLISRHFYYFGREAPAVPQEYLLAFNFKNARNHRTYEIGKCVDLFQWLETEFRRELNMVTAMPFQFGQSTARYSVSRDRIFT
jgi:hypothetical protein